MSEIQKPVVVEEQQPSVAESATPAPVVAESAPAPVVAESAPAPVVTESAPAPVVESTPVTVAQEEAKPVVEESKPEAAKEEFNGEGILGYKAPGGFLKKLAGFQKRHFWFGTDAVEVKTLSNYLRGEKPEVGNHNAAWAAHTGKGLLFFSKLASDKTPIGVINLADVTDIKKEGTAEFLFHSHGQKHVFQATSISLRDSWVETLEALHVAAKEAAESIKSSENYKNAHASLTKPVESAAPITPKEEKKEDVVPSPLVAEANTTATEVAAVSEEPKSETKEEKKARTKSRSASRKRQSIFGSFNIGGKKSEEVVPKTENKDEVKVESPVEVPVVAASEPAQIEPSLGVAPVVEQPTSSETTEKSTEEVRPAAAKRHSSLFDFKSRFGGQKKAATPASAAPAKDNEEVVTSAEAPVIPAVEQSEPLATSIASPATVPTETTTIGEPSTIASTQAKVEGTPETKADKRKSSLPFGFGSKKEKIVDGEKQLSPFAKLRQTVKGKKSEEKPVDEARPISAEKKSEEKPTDVIAEPKTEEFKEEALAPAPSANPTVSATA